MRVVAIDMCAASRAAVRQHLPHFRLVVDHFHLVQLANRALAEIRRRSVATIRAAAGRSDLAWQDGVRLDLYYVENWSLAADLVVPLEDHRCRGAAAGAY